MKKTLLNVILINILIFFLIPASVFSGIRFEMVAGQSKTIKVDDVKRVAVGNPDIADFSIISSQEVRVVAKSGGSTTLEIWDNNDKMTEYDLEVIPVDTGELIKEIESFLGKDIMRLVRMKPVRGGKILLEGEYDTQDDMKRLQKVILSHGDMVMNFLKPSKILRETSAFRIAEIIGSDTVDVKMVNKTIFLDGMVPTEEDRERAKKVAKMFSKKVVNGLRIGSDKLIQVDVKIYEMSAEFTSNLDLNLISPARFTSSLSFGSNFINQSRSSIFSSILNIDNALDAAIGQGRGKMLARPKLVTVNGGKAKFMSGGERGYGVLSSQGVPTIEWKNFGIELEIEPLLYRINGEENIKLHINAVLSELDELRTTVAVAALNKSYADVNVNMKPDETLMIAGLLKNKKVKTVSRFPILGYIPIIELLFKTTKEEVIEKELLMFITPRIVRAREIPLELTDINKGQELGYEKLKQKKKDIEE